MLTSLAFHSDRLAGTSSNHHTSRLVSHLNFLERQLILGIISKKLALSLMHRFIPSHLQLSYPFSHPWYTVACGEVVFLKPLAFASWKANLTADNLSSFHKAWNSVSTLKRARKHLSNLRYELSNLSPSSKSWWCLVMSVSGGCSPPSPPLPQMAILLTLHLKRLNA